MSWSASGASNIALIKYMGKIDGEVNRPSNASLSWTLGHLKTHVEVTRIDGNRDDWKPMVSDFPFEMSEMGRNKFLNHFGFLKRQLGIDGFFQISSANNFPADCGIASSASSFAALTEVTAKVAQELVGKKLSAEEKGALSALGSGSSCRSFLDGWVQWDGHKIFNVESQYSELDHMVILVDQAKKKVSSSQAHKLVPTSLLFEDRVARVEKRMEQFQAALQSKDWIQLFQISWAEFWDMHALFETAMPAFGYFVPGTLQLLASLRNFWDTHGDGPLVTMDAGPNIHLLWRVDQKELGLRFFQEQLDQKWTCLSNMDGIGFAQV